MPLSKNKQAEWMREYRKKGSVIPKSVSVIPNHAPYAGEIKPLPNCPDGRYRDGYPTYE